MITTLEAKLHSRGLSEGVLKLIHDAKICIIDDKIDDLKGLTEALKKEGFSNIVEKRSADSVDELLTADYDLIVLDLAGVAEGVFREDGVGVLAELKRSAPNLPVLVVSGSTQRADLAKPLSSADLIRTKPILSGDLAADVRELLKKTKDPLWAGLAVLRELRKSHLELLSHLTLIDRARLWRLRKKVVGTIDKGDPSVLEYLDKIASIVQKAGAASLLIVKIVQTVKGVG